MIVEDGAGVVAEIGTALDLRVLEATDEDEDGGACPPLLITMGVTIPPRCRVTICGGGGGGGIG